MIKVGLDVPHGENTPGKRVTVNGKVYKEHHFGSKLAIRMKELLDINGFDVVMPQQPFSNEIPLNERRDIYIDEKVDIVLSPHANWNSNSSANGTCAFYWHTDKDAKEFAEALIKEVKEDGDETHGNGFHASMLNSWTNLFIARALPMTSVLVENGFMSGSRDFNLIFGSKQSEYIERRARALVKGLCEYYDKAFKLSDTVKPSSSAKVYYRVQVGSYTQIPLVAAFAESVEKKTKLTTYITEVDGQMKVQVGAFVQKEGADERLALVKSFGYNDAFITTKSGQAVQLTEPYNDPIDRAPVKPAAKPAPKPTTNRLSIDGAWGPATTKRLQQVLGTQATGLIGGQTRHAVTNNIVSVRFGTGGSMLVREMQRRLGVKVDGSFGSGTLRALQRRMGTPVTGAISRTNSAVVKELQRRLNQNRF